MGSVQLTLSTQCGIVDLGSSKSHGATCSTIPYVLQNDFDIVKIGLEIGL